MVLYWPVVWPWILGDRNVVPIGCKGMIDDVCGRSQADLIEKIERYKVAYRALADRLNTRSQQLLDLMYKYDAAKDLSVDLWRMIKSSASTKPSHQYAEMVIDRMIDEIVEAHKKSEETTNGKEAGVASRT